MTNDRSTYGVWLRDVRVGELTQQGDYCQFIFVPEYVDDPYREVLGLAFEPNLRRRHSSALRLPPWFSNLLPEGRLRDWIASDRGVSVDREMELLAQVGKDLPGAIRVLPTNSTPQSELWGAEVVSHTPNESSGDTGDWKFSLAGVGMKFSMVKHGDRLTIPASGLGGDWIVKLPDPDYERVPLNEFAMMELARKIGAEVPETLLVHRDELGPVPDVAWQSRESLAYAVSRFDRRNGNLVHIEDFAQVKGIYPYNNGKYEGNFETVGAFCFRDRDEPALIEFVKRHVLNILISNGDAHLKNWSLIYRDPRRPTLSPLYDVVSTQIYNPGLESSALKFGGTKRFEQMRLYDFDRLQRKLGTTLELSDIARETVRAVGEAWDDVETLLEPFETLRESVAASIQSRSRSLLRAS